MAQLVEIDHRSNGGIDVSLMWDRDADVLYLQVIDWGMDEDYVFSIDGAHALDAFRHPFAYADRVFGADGIPCRRRPAAEEVQLGSR
jgi:hypothetical protein